MSTLLTLITASSRRAAKALDSLTGTRTPRVSGLTMPARRRTNNVEPSPLGKNT